MARSNKILIITGASLALAAPPASAQQPALGGGRALDANLQVGSGGINPVKRDVRDAIALQNAIVTGTASGARSFRGVIPYLATDDFRASLGSNDLFAFRRDSSGGSAFNGGLLGVDALRYQFSLTTGQTPPGLPVGLRPGITQRAGAGSTGEAITRAMRSTASFESFQGIQPTIIDVSKHEDGRTLAMTASPLTGVRNDFVLDPRVGTADEMERIPGVAFTGAERRARGIDDPLTSALRVPTTSVTAQRLDPISPSHRVVVERFDSSVLAQVEQPPEAPQDRRTYAERILQGLRDELAGTGDDEADTDTDTDNPLLVPGQPGADPLELSPWLADALRRGNIEVGSFEGAASTNDAYAERIEAAEGFLAAERYFDAEDSFTRALALIPADPMASVGRIHAQLGAGMYLSAAFNLRTFLTANPELAAVRYADRLLPEGARMDRLRRQLIDISDGENELARDAALLLAYIGHQGDEPSMVRTGLARFASKLRSSDDADASMLALVRAAWDPAFGAQEPSEDPEETP